MERYTPARRISCSYNLYAANKAVEFVPYVTGNLIVSEIGVTAEHWSERKQKAAVHEHCAYFGFHRSSVACTHSVDMIDIASSCAKMTYKSDFWRNRCVNHHYFLICTQGKS